MKPAQAPDSVNAQSCPTLLSSPGAGSFPLPSFFLGPAKDRTRCFSLPPPKACISSTGGCNPRFFPPASSSPFPFPEQTFSPPVKGRPAPPSDLAYGEQGNHLFAFFTCRSVLPPLLFFPPEEEGCSNPLAIASPLISATVSDETSHSLPPVQIKEWSSLSETSEQVHPFFFQNDLILPPPEDTLDLSLGSKDFFPPFSSSGTRLGPWDLP